MDEVRLQVELRAAHNILQALRGDVPCDAIQPGNGLLKKSFRTLMIRRCA